MTKTLQHNKLKTTWTLAKVVWGYQTATKKPVYTLIENGTNKTINLTREGMDAMFTELDEEGKPLPVVGPAFEMFVEENKGE